MASWALLSLDTKEPSLERQRPHTHTPRTNGTQNFVVCYDARTRNPRWVMERVTRATTTGYADRKVLEFYEEAGILDARFRTQNADYLMSACVLMDGRRARASLHLR